MTLCDSDSDSDATWLHVEEVKSVGYKTLYIVTVSPSPPPPHCHRAVPPPAEDPGVLSLRKKHWENTVESLYRGH